MHERAHPLHITSQVLLLRGHHHILLPVALAPTGNAIYRLPPHGNEKGVEK
jgi:hypothetical protein